MSIRPLLITAVVIVVVISLSTFFIPYKKRLPLFHKQDTSTIKTTDPLPHIETTKTSTKEETSLKNAPEHKEDTASTSPRDLQNIVETLPNIETVKNSVAEEASLNGSQIFALTNANDSVKIKKLLTSSNVDGIALQLSWSTLEPQDNAHNWTNLDNTIELALKENKKVTLHIFGTLIPSPDWLTNSGAHYYSFKDFKGKTKTEPLPWDPIYLSKYSEFLSALSEHLKEKDYTNTISKISVVTPVPEMSLISCHDNILATGILYDREKYLSAWKQMIDTYAETFPVTEKLVSAPVSVICRPEKDTQFYRDIMDYASKKYSKTFFLFAADLTSTGSDRMEPYLNYVPKLSLGYQTIWSSTDDTENRMKGSYPSNLKQAVCKALSQRASYFELYAIDVLNSDQTVQEAIRAIHDPSACK